MERIWIWCLYQSPWLAGYLIPLSWWLEGYGNIKEYCFLIPLSGHNWQDFHDDWQDIYDDFWQDMERLEAFRASPALPLRTWSGKAWTRSISWSWSSSSWYPWSFQNMWWWSEYMQKNQVYMIMIILMMLEDTLIIMLMLIVVVFKIIMINMINNKTTINTAIMIIMMMTRWKIRVVGPWYLWPLNNKSALRLSMALCR